MYSVAETPAKTRYVTTSAQADGPDAPVEGEAVMAPEMVAKEATASSGSAADMILPLGSMAVIAAAFLDS